MTTEVRTELQREIQDAMRRLDLWVHSRAQAEMRGNDNDRAIARQVRQDWSELHALLKHAIEPERFPVGGWRPIATAPRDGTEVLLAQTNPYRVNRGWFDAEITPGWIMIGGLWTPTHWQPLPAPPEMS